MKFHPTQKQMYVMKDFQPFIAKAPFFSLRVVHKTVYKTRNFTRWLFPAFFSVFFLCFRQWTDLISNDVVPI